jgi:hypothetical protein
MFACVMGRLEITIRHSENWPVTDDELIENRSEFPPCLFQCRFFCVQPGDAHLLDQIVTEIEAEIAAAAQFVIQILTRLAIYGGVPD